jgi:glycosyltransferase involved in cell wall biosynthesis
MLSVCILSRNSKRKDLMTLAESLHGQDLDFNQWELVLVDNSSTVSLRKQHGDLFAWHPNLKFATEVKPGIADKVRLA